MTHKLADGNSIPLVGFGTYKITDQRDIDTLKKAILVDGYRHIDTASAYQNEEKIGEILQEIYASSPIKREDMYLVTKLFITEKKDVVGALKRSLQRLKTDYVDLYLVHCPGAAEEGGNPFLDPKWIKIPEHVVWAGMEECVNQKLAKSIGVSNYNFQLLNDLLSYAKIRPVCNQIELHPYLPQEHLVAWLQKEHILPVAYAPLGGVGNDPNYKQKPIDDPLILELAQKHKVTPGQILLAWGLARGTAVIPKTSSPERSLENFRSQDVKLSEEEVKQITALDKNIRFYDNVKRGTFGKVPVYY